MNRQQLFRRCVSNALTPLAEDYIRADRSTDVGKLIASFDWDHASSYPALVHDSLCSQ